MNKILILIFFILCAFSVKSQIIPYPVPQKLGNTNTLLNQDTGSVKGGHILLSFIDTAAANRASHISFYDGQVIRVGDSMYMRSKNKWVLAGNGIGGQLFAIGDSTATGTRYFNDKTNLFTIDSLGRYILMSYDRSNHSFSKYYFDSVSFYNQVSSNDFITQSQITLNKQKVTLQSQNADTGHNISIEPNLIKLYTNVGNPRPKVVIIGINSGTDTVAAPTRLMVLDGDTVKSARYPSISPTDTSNINYRLDTMTKVYYIDTTGYLRFRDSTLFSIPVNGTFANGFLYDGGVTILDSTVTELPNIVFVRNDTTYTLTSSASYVVHTVPHGYVRKDIFWIDSTNVVKYLPGTQTTNIAVAPSVPYKGIQSILIDVHGDTITAISTPTNNNWVVGATNNIVFGTDSAFGTSSNTSILTKVGGVNRAIYPRQGGFALYGITGVQMNAISSPLTGTIVYNTDSLAYCYWDGIRWNKIGNSIGGGNFIPLTGTTVGNPVTGTVNFAPTGPPYTYPFTLLTQQDDGVSTKFRMFRDEAGGFSLRQQFNDADSANKYAELFFDNNANVSIRNKDAGYIGDFKINSSGGVINSDNPLSKGISGAYDFSPNITALDYPQKIYVDKKADTLKARIDSVITHPFDTYQWSVIDSLSTPPSTPNTGDIYLVGTAPTGAWAANANNIATYSGSTWTYETPVTGNLLYNSTLLVVDKYNGSGWVRIVPLVAASWSTSKNLIGSGVGQIGTIDNKSMHFYTNNKLRAQIDSIATTNIIGTSLVDNGVLGAELTTTGSGTNWTGSGFSTGYTHTTGSTTALTTTTAAVSGNYYYLSYTISGRTAGSITIAYGGLSFGSINATDVQSGKATATTTLSITPTTDFDGTIILSIKTISPSSPSLAFKKSSGVTNNEIRINGDSTNTFMGKGAGSLNVGRLFNTAFGGNALRFNTTGTQNVAVGYNALALSTTGILNTAVGYNALASNTTAFSNTAIGNNALASNTTGAPNTAVGFNALASNTTGVTNTAVGYNVLLANTNGSNNTASGYNSLSSNTTAFDNTAFGYRSMAFNTTGTRNTALGSDVFKNISTGSDNISIGYIVAGRTFSGTNGTGQANTLIGNYVAYNLYHGYNNTSLGVKSSASLVNEYGNVAIGSNALLTNGPSIASISTTNAGSGYVDGTYTNVNILFPNSGNFPLAPIYATVVITGGSISSVTITSLGSGVYVNAPIVFNGTPGGGTPTVAWAGVINTVTPGGNYNIAIGDSAAYSLKRGNGSIAIGAHVDLPDTAASGQLNIANIIQATGGYTGTTMSSTAVSNPSVAIGAAVDNSAVLNLASITKGLLIPRMTGVQMNAISSPAIGLLIWNTDSVGICQYTGSAWQKLSVGSGGGSSYTPTIEEVTGSTSLTITLSHTPILGSYWISKNGIDLPNAEFTQTGTTVTLTSTRATGDIYRSHYSY